MRHRSELERSWAGRAVQCKVRYRRFQWRGTRAFCRGTRAVCGGTRADFAGEHELFVGYTSRLWGNMSCLRGTRAVCRALQARLARTGWGCWLQDTELQLRTEQGEA